MKSKFKNFIIDVDGVLTDGGYYYTEEGKFMKKFGADDNDGLDFIKDKLNIHAITGDKRGFAITKKRVAVDMGLKLDLVSTFERVEWIKKSYKLDETIFMGDGIFDGLVFKKVGYSIAPSNAFEPTKKLASFVTSRKGSEGAVAEAVVHILKKFFDISFDINKLQISSSGAWRKTTTKSK